MKSEMIEQGDASLIVNNMAAISRQLEKNYRRFQTRELSEAALITEINKILKDKHSNTPVAAIIKALELRSETRDHLSRILSDDEIVKLNTNQLVLDAQYRISVPETIRQFYLHQLSKEDPPVRIGYCAIFGFTEFLGEHYEVLARTFFSDENKCQQLMGSFSLAILHGNLAFAQKIWDLAGPLEIRQALVTNNHYNAVAAGRASASPEIKQFVLTCVASLGLTDSIPEFTDEEMFPLFARANNREAFLACWKKGRNAQAYLDLLSTNKGKIFDDIADEFQSGTRDALLHCLIALSRSGEIAIPFEVWQQYFHIAVSKAPLSSVQQLWDGIEDPEIRKALLNHTVLAASDDFHVPVMKFILEQAESFEGNPIDAEKLHYIEKLVAQGLTRLAELFAHSPLVQTMHLKKL
jgi:hypothetical protein